MKFVPDNQFYQQHKYRIILIVCFEQIITSHLLMSVLLNFVLKVAM